MAELQVGIKANTAGGKVFVRQLKEIRKAATSAGATLEGTSAQAQRAGVSLNTTASASGKLAISQNLAATANVAVAKTLGTVAARATETVVAEKAATVQTNFLTAAFERMSLAGTKAFFAVGAGAKRFTTQARTAAGSLAGISIAAQGMGALVAVGIGVGIKSAVTFEKTLSRIEGLVGIASSEVEAFKGPLLDIAKATAKGPNELAEALFFVTSAGFEGKEALDILEASARAAAAGLGETKSVADAVTSAVNAYGIENLSAAKATDILVATVREGKAEADSIAGALGQILPTASELGIEFEELGGTIAALTRIGLGADQGATALGATMAAIQKPGADAKKALEEFGLSASGLRKTVREEGLLAGLQQMKEAFGDNETALTRVVPNIRALRAVLPLIGRNAGDVAKIFEEVADSAGAADKAFEVYAKTTSFELNQATVVLQTTLMKLGNDILPAVTKAFVWFTEAVSGSVDIVKKFSENVAEFFVGSDDPLIRARDQLKEVQSSLNRLSVDKVGAGAAAANAWTNNLFGVEAGNVKLEGSLKNQLTLLQKEEKRLEAAVQLNLDLISNQNKQKDAIEATVAAAKEGEKVKAIKVIDQELFDKSMKSFEDLKAEVEFFNTELVTLQEIGSEGIGLAEDLYETRLIFRGLQGETKITAGEIRGLINDKRALADAISEITDQFIKQEQATDFLTTLGTDTELLRQKFEALAGGASALSIDTLQQATKIFNDLSKEEQDKNSLDSIQQRLIRVNALNEAIAAIPVDKVKNLNVALASVQADLAVTDPSTTQFALLTSQAETLEGAIVKAQLSAAGLQPDLFLQLIPKEDQIRDAIAPFQELLEGGLIDPEQFDLVVKNIEDKINGVGDTMTEFAVQAARNLQTAFADFLFDPFSDGLDGLLANFTETLHRMAAELLSQQLLKSFFSSLGGAGGGIFETLASTIGGARAEGGPVQAGKSFVVGEAGPELFTPRQSGNITSNADMNNSQQAAPTVEVGGPTIINTLDDGAIVGAFNRGGGKQVILNDMTEDRAAFLNALGIR